MPEKNVAEPARLSPYHLVAGVVIFAVIVLVVNGLLSFVGLERFDKEFAPRSSYPIFVPGQGDQAGNFVTNSHFGYSLNYQTFPKDKAPGVTRIFVVGGSAAYGWPYTEQYAFSGYLRRALEHFAPGKFEVINAAGMSFGSHRVYDVLQDVVLFDPDLVIVYSGNNEYVERNVISGLKKTGGLLDRVGAVLGQTHIYRAVRLGLFRAAPAVFRQQAVPDLTDLRSDSVVSRGALGRSPQIDQEVLVNFKANITAMKDILLKAGAKVIFCTVPSNVVGYHPDNAPPKFDHEAEAAQWKKMQQEVLEAIQQASTDSAGKGPLLRRAEEFLLAMLRLDHDNPGTVYTLGQVLMGLSEHDRAYTEFVRAKDLDVRPIRELSAFNAALRSMVSENSRNQELMLLDLEELIAGQARRGASDWIFLDYCHFTEAAHKFVAISMLPAIQKSTAANLSVEQISSGIFNDDWGKHKEATVQMNEHYASGLTYIHNGAYEAAAEAFQKVLELQPGTTGPFVSSVYRSLSFVYQGLGDHQLYKDTLLKAMEANPDNHEALISAGFLFLEEGNLERSEEMFRQALRLNQYAPLAHEGLGRLSLIKGAAQEAITHYQGALQLGGDNLLLQKELGQAYLSLGDIAKAILAWQAALAFDSSDQETLELLKKYGR